MGLKLSWLAVENGDEAELLDRLGLEVVGEATDALNVSRAMIRLPSGWLLIVSEGHKIGYDGLGGAASVGRQAVTGFMSETVMASSLLGFRDGEQVWSVVHDPDFDPEGVMVTGSPPEEAAGVLPESGPRRQAGEPFDVPLHLMTALTGFAPYGDVEEGIWLVLAPRKRRRGKPNELFSSRITEEVLKLFLEEYGWSLMTERPTFPHRPQRFEVVRQRPHGLELIGITFADIGDEIYTEVNFYVGDGDPENMRLVLEGNASWGRKTLWGRIFNWGAPRPDREGLVFRVYEQISFCMTMAQWVLDKNYRRPEVKITGGVAKDTWPHVPPLARGA